MKEKPSSWRKWALVAAACVVFLIAGTLIALKVLFPPEKVQQIALENLESALGRKVRIASASIGLGGAGIRGLEVSDVPDFDTGTFLKAEELGVRVRLLPLLLRREIQIVSLKLEGWSVRIVAAGKEKPAEEAASGAKAAAGPALAIDSLTVARGSIEYEDAKTGVYVAFKDINGEGRGIRLDAPFDLTLSFGYQYGKGKSAVTGQVTFNGSIHPGGGDGMKVWVSADPLSLEYEGIKVEIRGGMANVESPEADFKLKISELKYETLKKLAEVPEGFHVPALAGSLKARYASQLLDIRELSLRGDGTAFDFKGGQTKKGWAIHSARILWKRLEIAASGNIFNPSKKQKAMGLDLKIDSTRMSLTDMAASVPAAVPEGLSGNAEFHVRVKGTSEKPSLSGEAKFDAIAMTISGQSLSKIKGQVKFTPESISGAIKGKLNKGELDIQFDARDYQSDKPTYTLKGKITELDLAKLPASSEKPSAGKKTPAEKNDSKKSQSLNTSGTITIGKIMHPNFRAGATEIRWNLKNLSEDLSKLGGTLDFKVGAGQFQDLGDLSDKPLVKIVLMPVIILQKVAKFVKVPLFPRFDKVDFKEITGAYTFTKGIMKVRESHLDSKIAYAKISGTTDLGKDRLDLRISTKLGVKQIAGPVGFKVKGSLQNPQVKLDVTSILKQPVVEKAIDQGRKLLEGFFKR